MADTIERLYKLTVDGSQAARSLKQIEANTASLDRQMASAINGATRFAKQLAAAFAVREVIQGFKGLIDTMDELWKDSQKIGIAAEELQRIRYAANLSGVSAENLNASMVRLAQAMTNLDDKGNKAAAVLRRFGVTQTDDSITALKKFADGIAKMPEGFEKTALAADLFGKKLGTSMIPMLNAGGDAFIALTKEADKFGGVVSEKTLRQAEEFNDNLERLQRVAKGVGMQLTEGMLPALVGITRALTDAATEADGFTTTGAKIGDMLANTIGYAIKAGATLEAFALTLQLVGDLAASNIFERPALFKKWVADINELDRVANARLANLRVNVERAKNAFAENPKPSFGFKPPPDEDPLAAKDRAEKAARAAEKLARERKRINDDLAKHEAEQAGLEEKMQQDRAQREYQAFLDGLSMMEKARIARDKDFKAKEDATAEEIARLDALVEMFETGTEAQKQYAAAQLVLTKGAEGVTETFVKERDELDVLNDAFVDFVDAAAQSAGHLSEAFKTMVQGIIAELLKLWAKKYILDVVAAFLGVDTTSSGSIKRATGGAFNLGRVVPFARGGVISQPIMMPMALMGEAGPEAILPLKRAADGNLGVQSQGAPPLNVVVNNFTDASIKTRRTGPNDLEVIVEQTRKAIAADLSTGGNLISRSFEKAYGIGRGAAAAF